jgi:glycosyltransferase involved in cell wall biosynthesis
MEVLIADGMSEDGTRSVLEEFDKKYSVLRVIDNPEKIAATGLNHAIWEAKGEIILRMDVHSLYAPDYIRTCIAVLQETHADNVGGPALTRAQGYIPEAIAYAFHVPFAAGGAKFRDPDYEGPVSTVPYGCWRKSTLNAVGCFDAELVRGQDDELNYRIVSAGGRVWQSPRIVSWYQPRTSLSRLFRQFFQNGFWKVAAVRKHRRPASIRNLVPVSSLFAGILLLLCAEAASVARMHVLQNASVAAFLIFSGSYLGVSIGSAVLVARRKGWKFLPILPVVFATYQLPYALGFLAGVFYQGRGPRLPKSSPKAIVLNSR